MNLAHQAPFPWGFSRQEYWSGLPCPLPGSFPNPGIKPRSPALQADSVQSEPPGKPMNTGVGSLSLLQGIFQTQDSNWDLLPCRMLSPSYFVLLIFMLLTGCHGSDSWNCESGWHPQRKDDREKKEKIALRKDHLNEWLEDEKIEGLREDGQGGVKWSWPGQCHERLREFHRDSSCRRCQIL